MFLWLCLNLFYVFVFLCKPTLAFSLNPSKRTDINTRMCSPVQFIYNVFHFSHAFSLSSYYFSKFRPNYKLVGCPMFMMGLASTSLLSEGSRRSFGMLCCLSVWGQIHERQTARGCVRYFCLVYFFVFVFVFVFVNRSWGEDKLMRGAQTEPVFARWRMIYLLGQEKTTRPLTDVFVFVL